MGQSQPAIRVVFLLCPCKPMSQSIPVLKFWAEASFVCRAKLLSLTSNLHYILEIICHMRTMQCCATSTPACVQHLASPICVKSQWSTSKLQKYDTHMRIFRSFTYCMSLYGLWLMCVQECNLQDPDINRIHSYSMTLTCLVMPCMYVNLSIAKL